MSQKAPILLLFFFFLIAKNALYANINPPDTCMTMLLHSGKKLQVSAVQMSAKIVSFRNCENYNRAQAIALDSILSITDAKGGRFYTAGDMQKKQALTKANDTKQTIFADKKHEITMETGLFHQPWFYIDEKKVSQAEFDAFLWRNLNAENTEYFFKRIEMQQEQAKWQFIGNMNYLMLLIFTIAKLSVLWLFSLPFAITAAIIYNVFNSNVKHAYEDMITAYYKQFK
jgi:hypothetical protein